MSNVRPHGIVRDTLKVAVPSVLAALCCVGFFVLGKNALSSGFVSVGKHNPITIGQLDSPVAFYLCVVSMFVFAIFFLAGSIAFWFVRGPRREHLVDRNS